MRYQRKLQTLFVLLCLFIVPVVFAISVGNILSALKAAQIIQAQLNKDITALAKEVRSIQQRIIDLESQKSEMIQTRDELWYIANEAYTEYCGAMLGESSESAETASYYWSIYKTAIRAVQYWSDRIEMIELEITLTTDVTLSRKNEELAKKREELKDLMSCMANRFEGLKA